MKRFLFCLILITGFAALPGIAAAQSVRVFNTQKASLTNTDTTYINCTVDDEGKSIQVVIKRVSGTAAGKAYLYVSNDGITYSQAPGSDSLIMSNAAINTKLWKIAPLDYGNYQIKVISSGTTVLTGKAFLTRRKL